MTEWTVFGPCSVSCGDGIRKRTRNYINEKRAKDAGCNMKLVEKEDCGAKCINDISCETTPWSEWQPCSTTCGKGYRTRTRKFKHRIARKVCSNIELVQREPCTGPVAVCSDNDDEEIDPNCTVTKWSEWSPCTEACGKGIKIRTRLYVNPYKSKNVCNVQLIQSIECIGDKCTTEKNEAQSNHSCMDATDKCLLAAMAIGCLFPT